MKKINIEELKYFNVEVLKKIRGRLQRSIYPARGKERVSLEEDHAYLSNLITRLETAAKLHKTYLHKQKQNKKTTR